VADNAPSREGAYYRYLADRAMDNYGRYDSYDFDEGGVGKQVVVGVCAMEKKTMSKPMKEILTRLEEFEYIKTYIFSEKVILEEPVEKWPVVDCLISFYSNGFPLNKSIQYAKLRSPLVINNLESQFFIMDRRQVYKILSEEGIDLPRFAVLNRDLEHREEVDFEEQDDHVVVDGVIFNKPFVEKPVDAEDHNIIIYYPVSSSFFLFSLSSFRPRLAAAPSGSSGRLALAPR
jgi:inositol hexakisphosphate/diphosphoinositol-pentakisphosphate kinase